MVSLGRRICHQASLSSFLPKGSCFLWIQFLALSACLQAQEPGVPTGGVTLTDTVGSVTTSLNGGAPVPLSGGKAVLTMIPSVAGSHTVTAPLQRGRCQLRGEHD